MKWPHPSLFEIFLAEVVLWLGLWLLSEYVATLLTLTVGAVVSAVLIVALLAEALERSRVPRRYFYVMALSIVAIVFSAAIYLWVFGGRLAFLQ